MFFTTTTTTTAFLLSSAILAHAFPLTQQRAAPPLAQVITKCTTPNTAALTFDDGPYNFTYDISKTLLAAGAKGTFFFNGNNYGCIYAPEDVKRVKYVYDKGHMVASHTWSHKNLSTLTYQQLQSELGRTDEALERLVGVKPAFMRPPYGSYNDLVRQVAAERGEKVLIWDFDSGDSTGSTAAQSEAAYDQVAEAHPSTILTINHETKEPTAHVVLPHAIKVLQDKGYNLVTVAECLGMDAYQSVSAPQTGTWTC